VQAVATNTDPTDLRRIEREADAEQAGAIDRRRKELDDLRWLLAHPQGRRITARLLDEAGVFRSTFNHSGSVMAFNEGRRHIGLFLTGELMESSADGYFKVLKEFKAKDE
jgi:hypothetical protein